MILGINCRYAQGRRAFLGLMRRWAKDIATRDRRYPVDRYRGLRIRIVFRRNFGNISGKAKGFLNLRRLGSSIKRRLDTWARLNIVYLFKGGSDISRCDFAILLNLRCIEKHARPPIPSSFQCLGCRPPESDVSNGQDDRLPLTHAKLLSHQ